MDRPEPEAPDLLLPDGPVLAGGPGPATGLLPDGRVATLEPGALRDLLDADALPVVCHGAGLARRLGLKPFPALEILELFAFTRPATLCVPTPGGLAVACDLDFSAGPAGEVTALRSAMITLLEQLRDFDPAEQARATTIARSMAAAGWPWGPFVLSALGFPCFESALPEDESGLEVWDRLPEWSEFAPEPPPGNIPVEPAEARRRLAELLGADAEARPQQSDYASAVSAAFQPRDDPGAPRMVLAEAGTGVGKTLGYLAAADLWARRNKAPVWISTYTRNLQHQIDGELERVWPDAERRARRVVIRKGRENYLCLLNMEEVVRAGGAAPAGLVGLGLVARWADATTGGDLVGGDFPGWLAGLVGRNRMRRLADRRGECIRSSCDHYHRCFVERGIRMARRARIVVANHALVLSQAAATVGEDRLAPTRIVFDEGHHLFAAADSAFSWHLTGQETAELRRWLRGAGEAGRRAGRARGLPARIGDLVSPDSDSGAAMRQVVRAAASLPAEGWLGRVSGDTPNGPGEIFLRVLRNQVLARAVNPDTPYSLEADTSSPVPGLVDAARGFRAAVEALLQPLSRLRDGLSNRLEDEAEELDSRTRQRIETACRGLERRAIDRLRHWRAMLLALEAETPEEFVDFFSLDREFGRDTDVGMHRHWRDPTRPLAEQVLSRAHGVVITSATLKDSTGDVDADWEIAVARSGAAHLPTPALRADVLSPFDHGAATRVFVVTDVPRNQAGAVAAAYRELFLASGGGALGIFTAISRLRATWERIAGPLSAAGLHLLAQHVEGLDTASLVDIFRAEPDACLLGTDAVRDGIDVPGPALRLVVFDRVPWPRPDILHRTRREVFGKGRYDDMIVRLRLKQAYGRMIRREGDRGVFVLLDPALPSRLLGAFPDGVEIRRGGLAEIVGATRAFLATGDDDGSAAPPDAAA